jgi:hypothetical protein
MIPSYAPLGYLVRTNVYKIYILKYLKFQTKIIKIIITEFPDHVKHHIFTDIYSVLS